jgi:hypothetical protein
MSIHRAHIVIPRELVQQIDSLVGQRGRSAFLVDAASRELKRLRQLKVLREAAGAWKLKDHPELKLGAARWVKSMRLENEKRFPKPTAH